MSTIRDYFIPRGLKQFWRAPRKKYLNKPKRQKLLQNNINAIYLHSLPLENGIIILFSALDLFLTNDESIFLVFYLEGEMMVRMRWIQRERMGSFRKCEIINIFMFE